MINLITENLEKIDHKHGLSVKEIQSIDNELTTHLRNFLKKDQGFYKTIDEQKTVNEINKFAIKSQNKYKHIVVLGIGGSALGAICLKQSLKHLFENELPSAKWPRLHVLDNIDPSLIKEIEDIIDYSKTLFIVITKSGSTVETGVQYFYFREKCREKSLNLKDHFVIITDKDKSFLRETAEKEGITTFEVPKNVGGRFSVLTVVGLLPAKLIGIDIEKLLNGAKKMRYIFLNTDPSKNLSWQIAKIQYLLSKKNKTINIMMPYSQKLIKFADWYRQLLAESIGKKETVGLTPINALGVTDQHSQLQLYNDGPNDKLTIFIELEKNNPEIEIPNPYPKKPELTFLNKKITFGQLLNIEKKSTEKSLTKKNRPSITILVDSISEESLGELFLLFEGATAFLGELFKINAFNQPGVELSKKLTKEALIK
jgi:glucose-6-phosphate isomerase